MYICIYIYVYEYIYTYSNPGLCGIFAAVCDNFCRVPKQFALV